ncbi:MlaC/ttg2D family ABC transporter substrate-binding protein [Commensalibacter oyaizuii]|uniref:ABC transporter substrate-binding protein n=1 Tax=Commensalibacter oyaizuii TaxID=3043873 RepID=A0ABT6Q3T4_9PROT|nr:ABC transporter substrate-binding protein [Commensalibacter sp. TBRC 16381]MDI2091790.1 ABC transporter substrate-binding protein [Commensalibacter sp. TBRC 16381]
MKTYSYRFLLSAFAVSGLLLSGNITSLSPFYAPAALAQSSYNDGQLRQWLQNTGNRMVSIVNSNLSKKEQKAKFLTILNNDVDVDTIAKFCLGRFWRVATPEQQKQYVQLFHQVLINSITSRLGEYKGVSFEIGKISTIENGRKSIETILHRPKQPDISIQWILSTESGSPKVVDIIGENASLSVTQRGDYTSFIARHGNSVDALITALKKQIANHS